jgi:deoxyhypusine synthase
MGPDDFRNARAQEQNHAQECRVDKFWSASLSTSLFNAHRTSKAVTIIKTMWGAQFVPEAPAISSASEIAWFGCGQFIHPVVMMGDEVSTCLNAVVIVQTIFQACCCFH